MTFFVPNLELAQTIRISSNGHRVSSVLTDDPKCNQGTRRRTSHSRGTVQWLNSKLQKSVSNYIICFPYFLYISVYFIFHIFSFHIFSLIICPNNDRLSRLLLKINSSLVNTEFYRSYL